MADDLGGRLVQAGLVTQRQLTEVRGAAPPHEGALVSALVGHGLPQDGIVGYFVAQGFGPVMEPADLAAADPSAVARVPGSMASSLLALPIRESPAGLIVAMAAPTDGHAIGELARATGEAILPAVARVEDLRAALSRSHPDVGPPVEDERESEPPPLELVNVRKRDARPEEGYFGSTKGAERVEARATVGPKIVADDTEVFVPLVRTKPVKAKEPAGATEARAAAEGLGRRVVTKNFAPVPKETREVAVGGSDEPTPKGEKSDRAGWAKGRALRPPGRGAAPVKKTFAAPKPEAAPRLDRSRHGVDTADTEVQTAPPTGIALPSRTSPS
ncbi:MAG: hypothetical protein R3B82_14045 [Sandaracinaceae bacterium]